MDQVKIDNFKKEHPDVRFPEHRKLTDEESRKIRDSLLKKFQIVENGEGLRLVDKIVSSGAFIDSMNASNDDFVLINLLSEKLDVFQDKIYINWYRFDDIDEMLLADLNKYFDDIWYSGPDDIDIFDASLNWIVSIRHDGAISIIKI